MGKIQPLAIGQMLAPGPFGGLERVVGLLSQGLAERGHQVTVVAILDPGAPLPPAIARLQEHGVACHALPVPHRAYGQERAAVEAFVRERSLDVVHTHGYRVDVLHRPVVQRLGVPVVSTAHGFTGGGWKNRCFEWLQVRSWRKCNGVIAVAEPLGARLRSQGVAAARLHVIPNAWALEAEILPRREARASFGLSPEQRVIGWVGRLTQEKGPDIALHALVALSDPEAVLVFVGSGREEQRLRDMALALGVAPRVRFLGALPDAARWYRAFDVLLLSSRTEGTPMVLFEAMQANVPIVAAAIGGVPDVLVPGTAHLAPAEDVRALARALDTVLADPVEAERRATRARRRLETAYAMTPWLQRHEALYRSVCPPSR